MLRINKDGTIPTDNPFFSTATGQEPRDLGARPPQPVHVRVQPGGTEMFINDVGQNTWEEINDGMRRRQLRLARRPKGRRPIRGSTVRDTRTTTRAAGARSPAARSTLRSRRSFPSDYLERLLLRRLLRRLDSQARPGCGQHRRRPSRPGSSSPVDLKVADDGSLYYLARGTGATTGVVYRIEYGATAPTHHDAPGEPDRRARRAGDVQRARVRPAAAALPVAAQRRQHRGRDGAGLHDRVGRAGRQRRAVPRRGQQRLRQRARATRRC